MSKTLSGIEYRNAANGPFDSRRWTGLDDIVLRRAWDRDEVTLAEGPIERIVCALFRLVGGA